ncbi:glycosyltransferase family 25 protein [Polynucleobacter sp. MWH-Loch1C5]|uniref:glycosyltransferase family 25 protein n=1 Tax=Polynucleobacter sp. MWH-Loch1C5 TaxID=2689108 RepID=UPI001C0DC672|nr:glycosyltransferase family 25 protein [Polynucleobacter sp. MWH-Loch1C5]MBU3542195.1 glycosyltransferase family 25 protein [Polynucleobacter sp. MWH-Loch1C5]
MSQNPQLSVDAVYVLSVKKFKDRIEHIANETRRVGINFEFIFTHDADEIDPDVDKHFFGDCPILAKPQRSLVLKHIEAWKYCVDRGHKRILVLEDDVIFHDSFISKMGKLCVDLDPISSYLVYLGGADTKVPPEYFLATGLIIKNPIATTDGYITDYSACKKKIKLDS